MISIISERHSPRLEYVCNVIFKQWFGHDYTISHTRGDRDACSICYGTSGENGDLSIPCNGLLFETGLRKEVPETGTDGLVPVLFPSDKENHDLSFDLFSAVFYMLSRYEEYLDYTKDHHGRFEVESSLQFRRGFHHIPVVDFWLETLRKKIEQKSNLHIPKKEFEFHPTYDIDQSWAYLNKGFTRNTAGFVKDLLRRSPDTKTRCRVLMHKEKDPYDTFDHIGKMLGDAGLRGRFFIHPGTYGPYDKNISLKNKKHRDFVRELAKQHATGIHPSYRAASDPALLKSEIELLSEILGNAVTHCRHHYLKIQIPQTYRTYLSLGITDDYSLGWADDRGFRAGCSRSFPFYDLENEQMSSLMLHPFCFMDSALKNFRKLSPSETELEIESLLHLLRETGGIFCSIWHNASLGTEQQWKGWREVHDFSIRAALQESPNSNDE